MANEKNGQKKKKWTEKKNNTFKKDKCLFAERIKNL